MSAVLLASTPPPLLPALLDGAVKGTILLLVAGVIALALRRRSAAARHLVWSLAVVGLLALPLLSALLPGLMLPAPWTEEDEPALVKRSPLVPNGVAELPRPSVQPVAPLPPIAVEPPGETPAEQPLVEEPVTSTSSPASVWTWLVGAWAAGAILVVLPLVAGLLSLCRLRMHCRTVTSGPIRTLIDELAGDMGLRRPLLLLQTDGRRMPMTWGLVRPVVLLPEEATTWAPQRLRVVLLHELAHVCRGDCLTQLLAHVARALYWFNPLAWLAVARLKVEQERACDDRVLEHGVPAVDYAEHLLAVTSGFRAAPFLAPVTLAMSQARRIERRLRAILDEDRDRSTPGRCGFILAAFAALLLLLPLAALGLQARAVALPDDPQQQQPDPSEAEFARKLAEVRAKILEGASQKPKEKALTEAAIRGLVQALGDPYAAYYTPEEMAEFDRQFKGNLTGIGVQLKTEGGKIVVVTLLENSPALEAGLRAGDVIVAVDGKPTAGLEMTGVVKLILGEKGTAVKLKVQRKDADREITITRGPITLRTVVGYTRGEGFAWNHLVDADSKAGYVAITQFNQQTPRELHDAVTRLKDAGMKGLVLDLRGCPGGLLSSALEVAKAFLPKGAKIVIIKGARDTRTFEADGKDTLGDFPLLVLVDEQTASAAEIVAGALRDNDRATLLGSRTFGKGTVQQIVSLEDRSAVRLTSAHYVSPSGRTIQKKPGEKSWGVDPHDGFYVPTTPEQVEAMRRKAAERAIITGKDDKPKEVKVTVEWIEKEQSDPQLAAALKAMAGRLKGKEFPKVGKPMAALLAETARREELLRKRESLQKEVEKVNKELSELPKR